MPITLDVVDDKTGRIESKPLDVLDKTNAILTLECLTGASALQVVLRENGVLLCSAEIEARRTRTCEVLVSRLSNGRLRVDCPPRAVFTLSVRDSSSLVMAKREAPGVDLLFLIDGTTRHVARITGDSSPTEAVAYSYLLEPRNREQWRNRAEQFIAFASVLNKHYKKNRFGVLAFGDDPLPGISNRELKADYRLKPDPAKLAPNQSLWCEGPDRLLRELVELDHTPGGDFVDALADGFSACRNADWRHDVRKIVFLFGDSPGYSVLHPAPRLSNFIVRHSDTDAEADALFNAGIEVVTLYKEETDNMFLTEGTKPFLEYARGQYARAASCAEYALTTDKFDVENAAAFLIENSSTILGRGACPGFIRNCRASA